jgi:hypothetical protein
MKERDYQKGLVTRIKNRFPGCMVIKNDPRYKQGMPDLLVLYKDNWGALEVKKDSKASVRPNQKYRVNQMNEMSFSSFIFPENEEAVLNAMERSFKS